MTCFLGQGNPWKYQGGMDSFSVQYGSSRAEVILDEVNEHGQKCSMMNSTATLFATRGEPHHTAWISAASHHNKVGVQLTMQPCIVWDPKRAHMQPPIWVLCLRPRYRCSFIPMDQCQVGTVPGESRVVLLVTATELISFKLGIMMYTGKPYFLRPI